MNRLIRKAARTPDAKKFSPIYDEDKKLIPFNIWLETNKDIIKFRVRNFITFYYINKKTFTKLDYLNNAIKGKNKKRFYERIVNIAINDPRLLDRKLSAKCINLPKEYMKNDTVNKSNLMSFLKNIMLNLYTEEDLDKDPQWVELDKEFRDNRNDDDLTHLKDPEFANTLKVRMLEDLESKLKNKDILEKAKQNSMSVDQLIQLIKDEIINRKPHYQCVFYETFKFAQASFTNNRFMKMFKQLLDESINNDFIEHVKQIVDKYTPVKTASRLKRLNMI